MARIGTKTIEQDGHKIRLFGSKMPGEPVLCVPGIPCKFSDWRRFLRISEQEAFAAVVMERPNWGESAWAGNPFALKSQLGAIDLAAASITEKPILVLGHSFGSILALLWALDHPARIKGVFVASGPAIPERYDHWKMTVVRNLSKFPLMPPYWQGYFGDAANLRAFLEELDARLSGATFPIYATHGDRDGFVNIAHLRYREEKLPNEVLLGSAVIPGKNHLIPERASRELADHLEKFLNRIG